MKNMEHLETLTVEPAAQEKPAATAAAEEGLRFSDPYWDDAFCAWWDPTLRTCC